MTHRPPFIRGPVSSHLPRVPQHHSSRLHPPPHANQKQPNINQPVSLISTMQPLVSFSMRRRREASCSWSPGDWASARIPSMRMGLPVSVDSTRRCLKCSAPRKRSMVSYCGYGASYKSTRNIPSLTSAHSAMAARKTLVRQLIQAVYIIFYILNSMWLLEYLK